MVRFYYMPGSINPADILSKHWAHANIWKMLQPILFWQGDTFKLFSTWSTYLVPLLWLPHISSNYILYHIEQYNSMGSIRKQKVLTLSLVVTHICSHTYLYIFYIHLYTQAMMYMLSLSSNDVLDTKTLLYYISDKSLDNSHYHNRLLCTFHINMKPGRFKPMPSKHRLTKQRLSIPIISSDFTE
jgi:hypothetical protein